MLDPPGIKTRQLNQYDFFLYEMSTLPKTKKKKLFIVIAYCYKSIYETTFKFLYVGNKSAITVEWLRMERRKQK